MLSLLYVKNVHKLTKRYFSFSNFQIRDSFLHNNKKKEIIVLHPVLNNGKRKKRKHIEEIILDAQEALGLARSANFKIARGISIPVGGWNIEKDKNKGSENDCDKQINHDNSNYEQDNHEKKNSFTNLSMTEIERKIAESIIIKSHNIDNQFFFGKGKLNDIGKYYLKNPTPYVFINTLLSAEQLKNLDIFFNSLLKGYQNDLKLESEKRKLIERENLKGSMLERKESKEIFEEGNDNEEKEKFIFEDEERASQFFYKFYNDYVNIEKVEKNNEKQKEEWEEEEEEENFDWKESEDIATVEGSEAGENNKMYYNYEKKENIPMYVEIYDRYSLILYIFKKRANSNVTKLQVEIARAKFILNNYAEDNKSRIKYFQYIQNNVLSKSFSDYEDKCSAMNTFDISKKGKCNWHYSNYTSNFIKNSETYKEYENRIINNLFNKLKKELEKCERNRNLQNKSRNHKALIAIVGYTNVGKTMLINYLTKSNLKVKNVLFQTLDNSYKNLHIANSCSTILVDSIGFIQNIPHSLLEAFKVSLEAIKNADIIIHVVDATHPHKEEHKKCVLDTLKNIGISPKFINNNVIEVWNKIDKLSEKEITDILKDKPKNALPISAYEGTNCDVLLQIIQNIVNKIKNVQIVTLQFETKEAQKRIEFLSKYFKVVPNSITCSEDGNVTSIQLVENPQNLKKYYEKFDL